MTYLCCALECIYYIYKSNRFKRHTFLVIMVALIIEFLLSCVYGCIIVILYFFWKESILVDDVGNRFLHSVFSVSLLSQCSCLK